MTRETKTSPGRIFLAPNKSAKSYRFHQPNRYRGRFVVAEALSSSNQALCYAFLSERGFHPSVRCHDGVTFFDNGRHYVARVDVVDSRYFQLGACWVSHFESQEERLLALAAASAVNARRLATKVFVKHDGVHLCVELLLTEERDFARLFDHAFKRLNEGVEDLRTTLWSEQRRAFVAAA